MLSCLLYSNKQDGVSMPRPRPDEERDAFLDRCMESDEAVSDFPNRSQRFAVCQSFWERRNNQDDINFTPPQGVRSAARRGIEMHEDGKSGDGIEPGTIRIARKLAAGEAISEEQARKGNRFWGRNERFLSEPKDSPAYVSALLWGGRPGMSWYRKLFRQLEARKGKSNMSDGQQVRVNIKSRVNAANIMRGERNGREVIIVPSATLPDDVVMNNIKYPAEEIEASFRSLNQTPAPLGHPVDENGDFMSATSGDGLNGFYVGAFNENARRRDGRVFVDKIIDVEMANALDRGKRLIEALNQGDPIHTSTGLLCNIEEAGPDDGCDFIARNIIFDHDAILLDETGAATPEQGVGMMVNKALDSEGNKISVYNCEIDGVDEVLSEPQKVGLLHQIKTAIKDALAPERKPETNSDEVDMTDTVDKAQFDELSAKVNALAETLDGLDFKSALNEALEPITEKVDGLVSASNAEKDAKRNALVERVVNKGMLEADVAKETPIAALEAMLANTGGPAAGFMNGFDPKPETGLKRELPED